MINETKTVVSSWQLHIEIVLRRAMDQEAALKTAMTTVTSLSPSSVVPMTTTSVTTIVTVVVTVTVTVTPLNPRITRARPPPRRVRQRKTVRAEPATPPRGPSRRTERLRERAKKLAKLTRRRLSLLRNEETVRDDEPKDFELFGQRPAC